MGKHVKVNVKHIFLRPYHASVGHRVLTIVTTIGSKLKRNLVLVVVVFIVATHTHEHGQLVVLKSCSIRHQMVGMHKHLHVFILAQIEVYVTINGLRLTMLQILNNHIQCLLIVLNQLWL